jgi:hypothetical protein
MAGSVRALRGIVETVSRRRIEIANQRLDVAALPARMASRVPRGGGPDGS